MCTKLHWPHNETHLKVSYTQKEETKPKTQKYNQWKIHTYIIESNSLHFFFASSIYVYHKLFFFYLLVTTYRWCNHTRHTSHGKIHVREWYIYGILYSICTKVTEKHLGTLNQRGIVSVYICMVIYRIKTETHEMKSYLKWKLVGRLFIGTSVRLRFSRRNVCRVFLLCVAFAHECRRRVGK